MRFRFALVVLACLNVLLAGVLLYEKCQFEIQGTYICENENPEESLYLVFEKNGTFQLYKQFQPITEGTYSHIRDAVYQVDGNNHETNYAVYDGKNTVYCFLLKQGQIYQRISKVPVYINLK
jgi:hypothetical protein